MRLALALAAGLLAGGAAAQAPDSSLRPAPRPAAETPLPPIARPEVRPLRDAQGPAPLIVDVQPDGAPNALGDVAGLPAPPSAEASGRPARDYLPVIGRRAPLLGTDPSTPRLLGPRAVVRAEEGMAPLPPLPVTLGAPPLDPRARPEPEVAAVGVAAPGRPRLRPDRARPEAPGLPGEPAAVAAYAPTDGAAFRPGPDVTEMAVAEAVLPLPRPVGIVARAEAAKTELARGQICGNPLLQGEAEASFGTGSGCGIDDPVRLRSVDGVRLSDPALMDCATAEALLTWVQRGARPALAGRGGGLARIDVMGHYACRPRNNQAGERLSEHGLGHAIDVGGLTMADGSSITVLGDWPNDGLRAMHDAACGPFSTVLGPEANAFHRNHFHFDTARGRGPYCR